MLLASACGADPSVEHRQYLSAALGQCRESNPDITSVVRDDRQTLLVGGNGPYQTMSDIPERRKLVEQASSCLLTSLEAPDSLVALVHSTTRQDGLRTAEWSRFRLVWGDSPARGLEMAIGRRGVPLNVTIDYPYP